MMTDDSANRVNPVENQPDLQSERLAFLQEMAAVQTVIDKFWEVVPPLWREVRSHIRQEAVDQFQITVGQFHILRHIRSGKQTVSDLAETGHLSRPAISRAVDTLVGKGLVSRQVDPVDRRQVQLSLTEAGQTLLADLFGSTRAWMAGKLSGLEPEQVDSIVRGLEQLRDSFR